MLYDIVICHGPNYNDVIDLCVKYAIKNVKNYRNIYIVSYDPSELSPNIQTFNSVTVIHENIFPFTKNKIKELLQNI